jgi:hypothetical protein
MVGALAPTTGASGGVSQPVRPHRASTSAMADTGGTVNAMGAPGAPVSVVALMGAANDGDSDRPASG